ncbi:acyltransferase-domain-containing protein [Blakeslea trispora]|nr:acyltransferase-domain-containing protein [Blakeslea trispora]
MTATTSRLSKKKLGIATTLALGATYWYYKPVRSNPLPPRPYVPPPFVWESIPKSILKRFTVPDPKRDGVAWNLMSSLVIGTTGLAAKGFMHCSQLKVHGLEQFKNILEDPHRKKGIITDDPFLWGILPAKTLFSVHKMRWVLGAADICYTSIFRSYFFALGQTIPTMRGAGIYQPGIDFAIDKVNHQGWIHIYPEAKVVQENKMIRFKWGVGRILMDADHEPIVIPVWHRGMHLAKPLYGTKLVHLGKPITLVFGEPVYYSDILKEWKEGKLDKEATRIKLTQRLYDAIEKLQKEYDQD